MTLATAEVELRHEALLYAGSAAFLDGTLRFIGEGLSANEPMLVAVSPAKIESLRQNLGTDADRVCFANMHEIGANPARIIPFWQDFIATQDGRPLRGIGEPIWAGRSAAELVECQRHESLLNVAIDTETPIWLLCPYDATCLDPEIIDACPNLRRVMIIDTPLAADRAKLAVLQARWSAVRWELAW